MASLLVSTVSTAPYTTARPLWVTVTYCPPDGRTTKCVDLTLFFWSRAAAVCDECATGHMCNRAVMCQHRVPWTWSPPDQCSRRHRQQPGLQLDCSHFHTSYTRQLPDLSIFCVSAHLFNYCSLTYIVTNMDCLLIVDNID